MKIRKRDLLKLKKKIRDIHDILEIRVFDLACEQIQSYESPHAKFQVFWLKNDVDKLFQSPIYVYFDVSSF